MIFTQKLSMWLVLDFPVLTGNRHCLPQSAADQKYHVARLCNLSDKAFPFLLQFPLTLSHFNTEMTSVFMHSPAGLTQLVKGHLQIGGFLWPCII